MTQSEFEHQYAGRSVVSVALLHARGRYGKPCNCGDEICEGWEMAHADEASFCKGCGQPVVTMYAIPLHANCRPFEIVHP